MLKKYFIILFFAGTLFAQLQPERVNNTFHNMYTGFTKTFRWYDVLAFAAYQDPYFINEDNIGDKIFIPPVESEIEIIKRISLDNHRSIGSMDKDLIPNSIFIGGLSVTTLLNLYTDADITPEYYHKIFLYRKSLLYTDVAAILVKGIMKRTRPDGSDNRSLFSSHAATTFAAATFIYKELHHTFKNWDVTKENPFLKNSFETISFTALYGWAGYVGYSRVRDKVHYLSDVVLGAIVGTAISYFLYEDHFGLDDSFLEHFSFRTYDKDIALDFRYNLK